MLNNLPDDEAVLDVGHQLMTRKHAERDLHKANEAKVAAGTAEKAHRMVASRCCSTREPASARSAYSVHTHSHAPHAMHRNACVGRIAHMSQMHSVACTLWLTVACRGRVACIDVSWKEACKQTRTVHARACACARPFVHAFTHVHAFTCTHIHARYTCVHLRVILCG